MSLTKAELLPALIKADTQEGANRFVEVLSAQIAAWLASLTPAAPSIITANVASGTGPALTSNVFANIASVSLPIGTWAISGKGGILGSAGLDLTYLKIGFATVNNTLQADAGFEVEYSSFVLGARRLHMAVPTIFVTLAAPTIYYMNINAIFTGGTSTGYGTISALKVG